MNKRALNLILSILFLILLIALPLRSLFFIQQPDNNRGDAATTTSYIMLFLFGALTLVFAFRAIKGGPPKSP